MLIQAEEVIHASLVDDAITVVTGQLAGTSNYRTLENCRRSSTRGCSGASIGRIW